MEEPVEFEGLYWTLWWLLSLRWMKHVIRSVWVVSNNFYVIPAHCVWLGLLWPLSKVNGAGGKELYLRIEELFFSVLLRMVALWNHTAGYKIVESGDKLDDIFHTDNFLFMPNHQSTADVPLCMTIFSASHRGSEKVMWVMDKVFKWTNFGIVSWLHDDFFILAGKENRDRTLVELKSHLTEVFEAKKRRCLVVFPEGGFLRKRKAVSNKFALKNNLPLLDNVTLPRTGALEVVMDVLGPTAAAATAESAVIKSTSDHNSNGTAAATAEECQSAAAAVSAAAAAATDSNGSCSGGSEELVNGQLLRQRQQPSSGNSCSKSSAKTTPSQRLTSENCNNSETPSSGGGLTKIVDVTMAYERGRPFGVFDIISAVRPPCVTHVHYRIFDIKDVPSDPEKLRHWMYRLYIDKEKMLQKYYESGEFPYKMFNPNASPPRELGLNSTQVAITNVFYLLSTALFWFAGTWLFSNLTTATAV